MNAQEIKPDIQTIKVAYTITVDVESWMNNYYEKPNGSDIREEMREEIEAAFLRRGVEATVR